MKKITIINPQQKRSKEKFSRLIQAATRVLERDGFTHLTTANIALEADVSIGTLYDYFSNKEALLIAYADNALATAMDEILALAKTEQFDIEHSLQAFIQHGIRFAYEERSVLRTLLLEMPQYLDTMNLQQSHEKVRLITTEFTQQHNIHLADDVVELNMFSMINIMLGFQFRIAILQDESYEKELIIKQIMRIIRPMISAL